MREGEDSRWRNKSGRDRFSKVNKWENRHRKGDIKMAFTGRELLISSLTEKCLHRTVTEVIEKGQGVGMSMRDARETENNFINSAIQRI